MSGGACANCDEPTSDKRPRLWGQGGANGRNDDQRPIGGGLRPRSEELFFLFPRHPIMAPATLIGCGGRGLDFSAGGKSGLKSGYLGVLGASLFPGPKGVRAKDAKDAKG